MAPSVPEGRIVNFANGVSLDGKFREPPTHAAHASHVTGLSKRNAYLTKPFGLSFFLVPMGMAVFLTMIGAFGTDEFSLIKSFSYWTISLIGGSFIASLFDFVLTKWPIDNPHLEWLIMFMGVAFFVLFYVWWLNSLFFEQDLSLRTLRRLIIPVIVISAAMTIVHILAAKTPLQTHAQSHLETTHDPGQSKEDAIRPIIYERLEPHLQNAQILAVQSEDHYLKIYTSNGEAMILMRLRDAVHALEGIEGSQVHRSWWVAKSAITDIIRREGRTIFHLSNGLNVPISRRYLKALKDTGWLGD
jgi:hypothetical protein